jgi:hypothetical protein
MIYKTQKGQVSAGEAIGILLLDTSVPFIPGDVANATTYSFPVRFHKVEGFTVQRAIGKEPAMYDRLREAAETLVQQGVRAVTGKSLPKSSRCRSFCRVCCRSPLFRF